MYTTMVEKNFQIHNVQIAEKMHLSVTKQNLTILLMAPLGKTLPRLLHAVPRQRKITCPPTQHFFENLFLRTLFQHFTILQ